MICLPIKRVTQECCAIIQNTRKDYRNGDQFTAYQMSSFGVLGLFIVYIMWHHILIRHAAYFIGTSPRYQYEVDNNHVMIHPDNKWTD